MRRFALALLLLLAPTAARAQYVQQSGTVTPGHLTSWAVSGVVQDAGTATQGKVNSLGLYGLGGTPFCITNSPTGAPFSGSLSQFCMGISASAAYLNVNGPTALPFQININGSTTFTVGNAGPTFTGIVTLPDTGTLTASANTFVKPVLTPASTTSAAGINLAPGTAPTSPNNGDCWVTAVGLYCQINGSTIGPYISGGNCVGQAAREVTSAGAVTVSPTDCNISVNKTVGQATAVYLPSAPTAGQTYVIADGKGDAQTNNITLYPTAGTIAGRATYVLRTNYASTTVWYTGSQWLLK